jgi:hypothetical protein
MKGRKEVVRKRGECETGSQNDRKNKQEVRKGMQKERTRESSQVGQKLRKKLKNERRKR